MSYPLLFKAAARLPLLLLITLAASGPGAAAEPALSLAEALAIAVRDSALLTAQRSAIDAAGEYTVSSRELPDPKLKLGIDNLPLDGADKYNFTRGKARVKRPSRRTPACARAGNARRHQRGCSARCRLGVDGTLSR